MILYSHIGFGTGHTEIMIRHGARDLISYFRIIKKFWDYLMKVDSFNFIHASFSGLFSGSKFALW